MGQSQSINVGHLKNGSAIIEFKNISNEIFGNNANRDGEYWITAQTNILLQAALKKAITWADLNKEHQKEFEKEIIRVRVTDKETYEFYRHYIPEFSKEAKLIFQGYEDGSFTLSLIVISDIVSIDFISVEQASNFIKLLQGRSVNSEIDNIFR